MSFDFEYVITCTSRKSQEKLMILFVKWVETLNEKLAADGQDKVKIIDYNMVEIQKKSHLSNRLPIDLIFADAKKLNKPVLIDGISIPVDDPFSDSNFLSLVFLFIPGSKYHGWNVAPWSEADNRELSIGMPSFASDYHHDWYAKLLRIIASIEPSIEVTAGHVFGIASISELLEGKPVERSYDDQFESQLDLLADDYVARKRIYEDFMLELSQNDLMTYWDDEYWLRDLTY